jgi:hypothetical protein
MSDLNAAFEAAVANSKNLSERPDNATLLKIYALYKQAPQATTPRRSLAFPTWWAAPSGMPGTTSRARRRTTPSSSTST